MYICLQHCCDHLHDPKTCHENKIKTTPRAVRSKSIFFQFPSVTTEWRQCKEVMQFPQRLAVNLFSSGTSAEVRWASVVCVTLVCPWLYNTYEYIVYSVRCALQSAFPIKWTIFYNIMFCIYLQVNLSLVLWRFFFFFCAGVGAKLNVGKVK